MSTAKQAAAHPASPTCHLGCAFVAGTLDVAVQCGEKGAVHQLKPPTHGCCHSRCRSASGCLGLAALVLALWKNNVLTESVGSPKC